MTLNACVLSSAGYTPGYFKQVLHDDILVNQLRSGLAGSDFATPAELDLTAKVVAEQRDVRYVTIPQEKFISATPVKDEEVARRLFHYPFCDYGAFRFGESWCDFVLGG